MSAALVQDHLNIMTSEFVNHIRRNADLKTVAVLAGPKRGNALLIAAVAHCLHLTPIFVKERPLFGKSLEGVDGDPTCAAVIDDISSDGELLANCVEVLRTNGYVVKDAYVLVDRTEGDSSGLLSSMGVALHPLLQLNDQKLREIVSRARQTSPA